MVKLSEKLTRKKKKTNDYPKFAFRISEKDKDVLTERIDRIYYRFQDAKDADSFSIYKNDIILEALDLGLKQIEDKLPRSKKTQISIEDWKKRNKKSDKSEGLF